MRPSPSSLTPRGVAAYANAALFAGALSFLGCSPASTSHQAEQAPSSSSALDEWLPLVEDTVSQFETNSDDGELGMFVLEINRPRPELAELRIAGRVQRLLLEPGRVRHATGGVLLEEPLEVGHTYRGSFGQVTITDLHHVITVPAGHFDECLVTVEEAEQPPRRATSVYCKQIGLVALTVESFGPEGGVVENRLTQHGPRFK